MAMVMGHGGRKGGGGGDMSVDLWIDVYIQQNDDRLDGTSPSGLMKVRDASFQDGARWIVVGRRKDGR